MPRTRHSGPETPGLLDLVDILGEAIATAPPTKDMLVFAEMCAQIGACEGFVRVFFAEARKPRPRDERLAGLSFLIGRILETLRVSGNGGNVEARRQLKSVQDAVEEEIETAPASGPTLLMLARAFAGGGVDPGEPLRRAMVSVAGQADRRAPATDRFAYFRQLAEGHDNDPFSIHEDIATSGVAFPVEYRLAMISDLACAPVEAARQAAVGFVLDRDETIGVETAALLADSATQQPVVSISVERLARMRPWLPRTRQPHVDAAIKALRAHAGAPVPTVKNQGVEYYGTPGDGSGADTLFALARRPTGRALCSILIKHGLGVVDAWTRLGLAKAEANDLIELMRDEVNLMSVSPAHFERRLAAALADNAVATPPPFGLVEALETLAAGPIGPQPVEPAALLDELLASLPRLQTGDAAIAEAHRASAQWQWHVETLGTWFEAGEEVQELLLPLRGRKLRRDALLESLLPGRRVFWAARCAWAAAAFKQARAAKKGPPMLWRELALVGRDLLSDKPIRRMLFMVQIANRTIDALGGR